jgi:hypothetical protein
MENKYILYVTAVVLIVSLVIILYNKNKKSEKFSITLGTLSPQNKFYSKCTDNCYRNKTGDTSPGQFLWLCTDECQTIANARIKAGIPDLTDEEYQRHSFVNKDLLNRKNINNTADSNNLWDYSNFEGVYCARDIKSKCANVICPFAKNLGCMDSCMRTNLVQCGSGVTGGWKP